MTKLLKNFSIYYCLGLFVCAVLIFILVWFFDYEPNTSLGLLVGILAAMITGQQYARDHDELPSSGFLWKFAFYSFLVAIVISSAFSMALVASAVGLGGENPFAILADIPIGWVIGIFAFLAIIHTIAARYMFSMGANQIIKAKAKQLRKEMK